MATATIYPDLDGFTWNTGTGYFYREDLGADRIGTFTGDENRTYLRFSLTSIPNQATITGVDFYYTPSANWNAAAEMGIRAYGGGSGSRDIDADDAITRYSNCKSPDSLYKTTSGARTADTEYSEDLTANEDNIVEDDVTTNLTGVDYIILSFTDKGGKPMEFYSIRTTGTDKDPHLIVTYTPPATQTITATVINTGLQIQTPALSYDQDLAPSVFNLGLQIQTPTVLQAKLIEPSVFNLGLQIQSPTITRPNDPDNVSGKVGLGLITRGAVSSKTGDADATPAHLLVQSGTTMVGIGLNRDGSPILPAASDLGGQLSGATANMSELVFPVPVRLEDLEVYTINMDESRGDSFKFYVYVDGTPRKRPIGGPIKNNGRTIIPISRALGPVHRCLVQAEYNNTDATIRAVPCSITEMKLWGRPVGHER